MAGGFHEVVLSAFDIERIAGPMVAVGGYTRHPLPDAPPEQFAAWRVPSGCTRISQCLLTAPGDDRGVLRVVVFHGVEQRVMRSSQHVWDSGGHFDIDIYSADAWATYRNLQRHGWTAYSDPVDYSFGALSVREVVVQGPDGFVIGLIERLSPPLDWPGGLGAMSRAFNASQSVRDYDTAANFYRDILGWWPMIEVVVTGDGEPAQVIGLPMPHCVGVTRRIGIFHPEGVTDGSVELISCEGLDHRDFAEFAVAPNVGQLALRFPVVDARAMADGIAARGWPLYTPPIRLDLAPYGPATLFAVRTPDGALLEFYEAG